MFLRNGEALGSVLHSADPGANPETEAPEPKLDERTDSEREADEQAAAAREELGVPPRNGSREAWAEFLDRQSIDYPADPEEAGRNDLIALWDEHEGGQQ